MKKQVAVIGIGRFGLSLARSLYNLGHDVLAIDKKQERVQDVMGQVTHPVTGDGTNEAVLKELKEFLKICKKSSKHPMI